MRIALSGLLACGLVAFGYFLGTNDLLRPDSLNAQDAAAEQPVGAINKETQTKIQTAIDALNSAQNVLELDQLYRPAIQGLNSFAITIGGLDAISDLESDRGVDPETFVGLYAGKAVDEVAAHLSKDEKGRLTYKNKVVRLYPVSRLKQAFARRDQIANAEIVPE